MDRKILLKKILIMASCFFAANIAVSSEIDFIGDWSIRINQETGGKRSQDGFLSIRMVDEEYVAHIQGGPIKIIIDGENIEMAADDWTGASMPFERYYRGKLNKGIMQGVFEPEFPVTKQERQLCEKIPLGCPHPTGSWTAHRYQETAISKSEQEESIDLTGRWRLIERGMRRWTVDMTDQAKKWNEDFDVELDLPRQRCVSSGLVNGFGSAPEIYQDEKKVTMISSSEVRRIYLDDRKPPEFSDWYPLGFSSGRWEGRALTVETTNLMPSVRGFMGNPISDNAKVIEKYQLDNDGVLHVHMTLHDPENYKTPPIASAKWKRIEDKTAAFPLLCDPDSFYRQLYEEGDFDEYIKRGNRRY